MTVVNIFVVRRPGLRNYEWVVNASKELLEYLCVCCRANLGYQTCALEYINVRKCVSAWVSAKYFYLLQGDPDILYDKEFLI